MNIVVPMAGRGRRFAEHGATVPKPMIRIGDQTMIDVVLACLPADATYYFVVQREHLALGLADVLTKARPSATILSIDSVTDGPACSALVARRFIDNGEDLLIADCDSVLVWPHDWVLRWFRASGATGGVTLRLSDDPMCSYARIDQNGWVLETREKDAFTPYSTTGPYWWSRGRDFVGAADRAVAERAKTKGEYYVCPLYNSHIAAGGRVRAYFLPEFWPLGTPEAVDAFVARRRATGVS
jgi:NDP-sugar pyrophosphorylase family protein